MGRRVLWYVGSVELSDEQWSKALYVRKIYSCKKPMGLRVDVPEELCVKLREAPTVYHLGSMQCMGGQRQLPGSDCQRCNLPASSKEYCVFEQITQWAQGQDTGAMLGCPWTSFGQKSF